LFDFILIVYFNEYYFPCNFFERHHILALGLVATFDVFIRNQGPKAY